MMTFWHVEEYSVRPKWFGPSVRSRVVNAEGKIMVDGLDPLVATSLVAEHNHVIRALNEISKGRSGPDPESSSVPI